MFFILLFLTVLAGAAWVYLFFGPRRLPIIPFVDFVQLDAKSYNPVDRLSRLALRHAEVATGGRPDAAAVTRCVEALRRQGSTGDRNDPAWQKVLEMAGEDLAERRPPSVVLVVYAHNQADALRHTLVGLAGQAWWPLRVIVADDQSTDGTSALLQEKAALVPGLDFFTVSAPPDGWNRKTWARQQAVERLASTFSPPPAPSAPPPDWLLFLNADVELNPDAVFGVMHTAEKMGLEALSVLPRVECQSVMDKLMAPFLMNLLSLVYPAEAAALRPGGQYLADGSFFLIRRKVYEETGGWEATAKEKNANLMFATRIFLAGHKIRWFLTRELARVRSHSQHQSVWAKLADSTCNALYDRPEKLLFGLAAALVLGLAPYMSLFFYGELDAYRAVADPSQAFVFNILLAVASATGVLASAASLARMSLAQGLSVFWGFSLPFGTVVFMGWSIAWSLKRWIYGREEVRF